MTDNHDIFQMCNNCDEPYTTDKLYHGYCRICITQNKIKCEPNLTYPNFCDDCTKRGLHHDGKKRRSKRKSKKRKSMKRR